MPALKFKGFSLVEIMVTIAIIAIITSVGVTSFVKSQSLARDAKRKQDLRSLAIALELYYQKFKHYPCSSGYITSSGGGNWISNNYAYTSGCGTASDTFDSRFINQQPLDPQHPSKSYFYFGRGDGYATCTTTAGQSYVLAAVLENASDPEAYAQKQYTICGSPANGFGNAAFIISIP